jgi:hypothetical protein
MSRNPLFAAIALLVITGNPVQAALFDRGNGLIYDDALNITWLQDANYAKTSAHDDNGLMNWDAATSWADQLSYAGHDDWRLASVTDIGAPGCVWSDNDCGFSVDASTGEMASLYYDTGISTANPGPFENLKNGLYWLNLEDANDTDWAWGFSPIYGGQLTYDKSNEYYAWAVRSGDVSPVPVPAAAWLFASGMAGLIGVARKRRN